MVGDDIVPIIGGAPLIIGELKNGRLKPWVDSIGEWVAPEQMIAFSEEGRDFLVSRGTLLARVHHKGVEGGQQEQDKDQTLHGRNIIIIIPFEINQ